MRSPRLRSDPQSLSLVVATTNVVAVEVLPSARKHGIPDADIRHAVNNAFGAITTPTQPDFTMLIGPDAASRLLEIGVVSADENDYVIHAMPARRKYLEMINQRGDQP